MVEFDWTIRAGDVLTVLGAVYVGSTLLYKRGGIDIRTSLLISKLTEEITELKFEMKTFGTTVAQIAVQGTKIDLLMTWYDELRRGIGRITE